jgi:hypothetical protein
MPGSVTGNAANLERCVRSATNYVGAAAEVGEGPGTGSTGCDFTVTGTSGVWSTRWDRVSFAPRTTL